MKFLIFYIISTFIPIICFSPKQHRGVKCLMCNFVLHELLWIIIYRQRLTYNKCVEECNAYDGLPLMFQNYSTVIRKIKNSKITSERTESNRTEEEMFQTPLFYIQAHYDFQQSIWYSSFGLREKGLPPRRNSRELSLTRYRPLGTN